MTRWMSKLGLPLLAKELIEQAARKRTYIVRVLYAALLFFAAYLFFYETLRVNVAGSLAVLGRGREMFGTLVGLQFAGIYIFMPAMTCGVLTQEKERASLQLLFLTRLGPWAILFEKLTSRLVPMFGFLLLSLPLLAFAYTLGGISPGYLFAGVWMLVLATIQMGTLALACSAFFRTTAGAFIWSYLLTAIVFFGPGLFWLCLWSITGFSPNELRNTFSTLGFWHEEIIIFPFFGPVTFFDSMRPGMAAVWPLVLHSVLVLGASAVCLVVARMCVVRRAFLPPRNVMLNVFKVLDRIFLRLNENPVTRGFVFVGDKSPLPGDEPVAWRETAKRSLGKTRYLLRVFIALEVPVAILCTMLIVAESDARPLTPLLILVWIVAGLMVAAQSASLIAGERSHQTLEVLCTTPLAGQEIVRQKFRAVRRLMLVLFVPFATIFGFEAAMKWNMPTGWGAWAREFNLPLYLACSVLSTAVYLPLFAWVSFLIGLKVRTQARAIAGAMAVLVAWCVIPPIFIRLPLSILAGPGSNWWSAPFVLQLPMLASPMEIVAANEESFTFEFAGAPWVAVILNFIGYSAVLLLVRWACLRNVDRLLGRTENRWPGVDPERLTPALALVPAQPAGASTET